MKTIEAEAIGNSIIIREARIEAEAKELIGNCPYHTGNFQVPSTCYGFPDECQKCEVPAHYDHIKINII